MSFCFCTDQKDVAKNVYEVDQELGGGNCLFLRARGWGIDFQERKENAIPWGCARGGGAWLQVRLNHALAEFFLAANKSAI